MKTYLVYGGGIALAGAILSLLLHVLDLSTNPERLGTAMLIALVVGLIITVLGIVLGTKAEREQTGASGFSYGRAFKTGFLIVAVSALCGVVFNFVYFKFINPNFGETTAQWTQSLMERMGAPESQIEKKVEEIRRTSTVTRQLVNGLIASIVLGTLISLITAGIMKRAPKEDLSTAPPPIS